MSRKPNLVSTILSSLVFALVPMVSQAIGLGNIMLHSHLNEPLDADIAITDTKGVEPSDVIVTVADQKAYEDAGLQPIGWLTSIRFQVIKSEVGGRPILKLKTKEAVKDPFVDLLIDVKWPGGQLLREYTLLLDPPKSVIPTSRPVQKKTKISPVIGVSSEKISQSEPTILHGASRYVETMPGGLYGPICEESLWSIAKSLAHNTHTNVHQAVMAIAEKNPHAFRDGNINYMLSGAMLKLPDKAEIESYSVDQSQCYIAMQGQMPHEHRYAQAKLVVHAPKPVAVAQKTAEAKPQRPLKLVAPVQSLEPAVKANQETSAKTPNQVVLAERLTLIEEAIDTLKRTNEDVTRKNQSLQDQNQSLEKLLSMKEDEIKKLVDMVKQPNTSANSVAATTTTPQQQFAVAISDIPSKEKQIGFAEPSIASQMAAAKLPELPVTPNIQTTQTATQVAVTQPATVETAKPIEPNLTENEVKPNTIKVDNIAPHSQPQNKAISADDTPSKPLPENTIVSDELEKSTGSSLFLFLVLGLGAMVIVIAWLRRHSLIAIFENVLQRFTLFQAKPKLATVNEVEPQEMANYGLQFDINRALDAIAAQEKKFKKSSSTGVKLVKDPSENNRFDAKFADAEECISYERFGQAEKILKEILQQKPDEWLAVYKLLELYVLTEKYVDFVRVYDGLPADLKDIVPRIWSKIETLRQKVTNEAVRFQSSTKNEVQSTKAEPVTEENHFADLKKNYPLSLEGEESSDNINIEALPTAEVEELQKDPGNTQGNTQDIQKAQIALAKAYIDMGEFADAKDILNELKKEAFGDHLKQIEALLESIS